MVPWTMWRETQNRTQNILNALQGACLALACKELQAKDFCGCGLPGSTLPVVLALGPTNVPGVLKLGLRKLHAEPVSQGTSGSVHASAEAEKFIDSGVEIGRHLLHVSVMPAACKRGADFKTRMIHSCTASAVFPGSFSDTHNSFIDHLATAQAAATLSDVRGRAGGALGNWGPWYLYTHEYRRHIAAKDCSQKEFHCHEWEFVAQEHQRREHWQPQAPRTVAALHARPGHPEKSWDRWDPAQGAKHQARSETALRQKQAPISQAKRKTFLQDCVRE